MSEKTVAYTSLADATKEEIDFQAEWYKENMGGKQLADNVLNMLKGQKGQFGGAKVDLLEHGLQTATRAFKDGCDEELVVVALLHDVGEWLSPSNHGDIPAGILKPYISEKNWWILAHHEIFQGFYYYGFIGGDKNTREMYKDHPHYQATVDFCAKYDAPSFDPDYKSMDLEEFRPMVEKVFSRAPFFFDKTHPKAVAVYGKEQ